MYSILDFGAIPDGKTLCRAALQAAVERSTSPQATTSSVRSFCALTYISTLRRVRP